MNKPLHIAVFGAGSIGCYVGGRLAAGGTRVTFIGRPRYQQAAQENGLTLTHFSQNKVHIPPQHFDFVTQPSGLAGVDVVLICVKSHDSAAAGERVAAHAPKGVLVVSLQNGVSNPPALKTAAPDAHILGGVVPFNVTGGGAGAFHAGTEGDLIIEASDDPRLMGRLEALLAALHTGEQSARTADDITALQWGKLLINLNNGMNTLHGGTLKSGLMDRAYRRCLRGMINEGVELLALEGITPQGFTGVSPAKMARVLGLPNWLYKIIMDRIIKIDASARSSMLDDLEAGRASEINYLQGEIVRLAEKHGRMAPMNARMMEAVNAAFADGISPKMSGVEIERMMNA
ncbi:MAG: 2-dehydropantoate 2-reductase [Maricaulaceae bacterium]